jgi:hypothetical protein
VSDRVKKALAYRAVFHGPAADEVLDELANFCCANRTTVGTADMMNMAILEGRRQVWLHIQQFRNLNTGEEMQTFAMKADQ